MGVLSIARAVVVIDASEKVLPYLADEPEEDSMSQTAEPAQLPNISV